MVHGDDQGLVLPPRCLLAFRSFVVPIFKTDEETDPRRLRGRNSSRLHSRLKLGWSAIGMTPGSSNDWRTCGAPAAYRDRAEGRGRRLGSAGVARQARQKPHTRLIRAGLSPVVAENVELTYSRCSTDRALAFREAHTREVNDYNEFKAAVEALFASAYWRGSSKCEEQIKEHKIQSDRDAAFRLCNRVSRAPGSFCGAEVCKRRSNPRQELIKESVYLSRVGSRGGRERSGRIGLAARYLAGVQSDKQGPPISERAFVMSSAYKCKS